MRTFIRTQVLFLLPLCATALLAQGPRGGGFGPGGFGFGGFGGRGPGLLGAGTRTPITGAPYSATETLTTQETLANGNTISRTQTSTVARDSEGRISTSETITPSASSGKAAYTIQTIFDPVAGYRYELNSSTMIAIQTPLPKGRPATTTSTGERRNRPDRPSNPNVTTADLGTLVVNAVPATRTQVTETIPAGAIGNAQSIQVVRVTSVSTELKIPVEIRTSDPRFGSRDLEVTNIVQAEPSASLFTVPAGYTIRQGGGRGGRGGPGGPRRRQVPPAQ